jgi:phthiocerol/phenolphthiocerol synthesis type-I polyketide synthase D
MDLSLMFFASGEDSGGHDRYRLQLEAARFADREGFTRVWLPERHFVRFGALHPNPAVLAAALARETKTVRIAAGSVVLPLHDPLRVAEEWAVVDNLSGGRVDISFASGWNPTDFVLAPDRYASRREHMRRQIDVVRSLWLGETISLPAGHGRTVAVRTFPTPLQRRLPLWVTAARSRETFELAGELGANVLTYLVDLGFEGLRDCVDAYRAARAAHNHDPTEGIVTAMLHTYVDDGSSAREIAWPGYRDYLRENAGLLSGAAMALGRPNARPVDDATVDAAVVYQFDRIFEHLSLMGSSDACAAVVDELAELGVAEIACLVDFVPDVDAVLAALPALAALRRRVADNGAERSGGPTATDGVRMKGARAQVGRAPRASVPIDAVIRSLPHELSGGELYDLLRSLGGDYGPSFQRIERVWYSESEAVVLLSARSDRPHGEFAQGFDPIVIDNCLLAAAIPALAPAHIATGLSIGLPSGFTRLRVDGPPGDWLWSHARLQPRTTSTTLEADVRVCAEDGREVITADGLRFDRSRIPDVERPRDRLEGRAFRVGWSGPHPRPRDRRDVGSSTCWFVVSEDSEAGSATADRLTSAGRACELIDARELLSDADEQDTPDLSALETSFARAFRAGEHTLGGVVLLLSVDAHSHDEEGGAIRAVRSIQRHAALVIACARACDACASPSVGLELAIVTRGAHVLPDDPGIEPPILSALWGVGRTLQRELTDLQVRLIDLDPHDSFDSALLTDLVLAEDARVEVAVRKDAAWWPSVTAFDSAVDQVADPFTADPARAYLVTGGTGRLGLRVAAWLVAAGARHLILMSRRGLTGSGGDRAEADEIPRAVASLERLGARVYVSTADVSDEYAVRAALEAATGDGCPPIGGVFHLAGVRADAPSLTMTGAELRAALAPKVAGALVLKRVTRVEPLDVFLSFASVAGVGGSPGQVAYAAGNAFLDAFAGHQRATGLAATAIDWGPWAEGGMTPTGTTVRLLDALGVRPLEDATALCCLSVLTGCGAQQVVVADIDWTRAQSGANEPGFPGAWMSLVGRRPAHADPEHPAGADSGAALIELLDLSASEQTAFLSRLVAELVAEVLEVPPSDVATDVELDTLGVDSLAAMELRSEAQRRYGVTIPLASLMTAATIEDLAEEVLPTAILTLTTSNGPAHSDPRPRETLAL